MAEATEATRSRDRINPTVFYGSSIAIVVFALWTMVFTETAEGAINMVLSWVSNTFGWYYFRWCCSS